MKMKLLSLTVIFVMAAALPAAAAVYLVKPDGTGDYPTIQAAIDAASAGDEILLADGVFKGVGNRDLDFMGKAIIVRSQSGFPGDVTIDAEGVQWVPQRGFDFKTGEGPDSVVQDITITGGSTDDC